MIFERFFSRIFRGFIYLPKTLYLNFALLPFHQAKRLPIIAMGRTSLKGIKKGSFLITGEVSTAMICIGAQKTGKRGLLINKKTSFEIDGSGKIVFEGAASIGQGSSVCASGGKVVFGDKFSCNVNCFVYSQKEIIFGKDVLLGWNVNIRDNDGHPLYDEKHNIVNAPRGIVFGNHVWVAAYVDILKGVSIADGVIVGTRSLVTKPIDRKNTVIAGIPAKVVKENVFWEHD